MNYQIVKDEKALREFIEWLPELQPSECYYITLLARNKYSDLIKTDKAQLKRVTTSKQYMFDKIKQMECEIGSYKDEDETVPQESLALYITPNPRSNIKGAKFLVKELLDLVLSDYNGYNIQVKALTALQKSCSRTVYMDFDFDKVTIENLKPLILEKINEDCLTFVETHGGFHLLVEVNKIESHYKKSYYNNIGKLPGCDVRGDGLLPVPGCCQGGDFTPKFR